MNIIIHYVLLSLLPSVIFLHLWISPYTKVEESFNIQAVHDIITHGIPFRDVSIRLAADYDHITFTGAVPRTFAGALALSAVARPFISFCSNGKEVQILVRGILGLTNATSLLAFQRAVSQAFGQTAAYWYIVLQVSQFHVMYYASRTLPNFLAFPLVMLSLRYFILAHFGSRRNKARRCQISLALVTFAGVVFRSELAVLVLHMTGVFAISLRLSLRNTIVPAGVAAAIAGVLISVSVDSFFWQRFPQWPELDALLYNTVQGKSSDWGVSPWHYYFTNAIPKLIMNPFSLPLCIPIALASKATRSFSLNLLYPLLAFVAMYSLLPHKEWRFVVYIVPGLTAVASAGASWIWTRRFKSFSSGLLAAGLVASTLVSAGASVGLLGISSLNYPGAEALLRVQHFMKHPDTSLRVHLDNLSCQTGVTRFLQDPPQPEFSWEYDKTDNLTTHLGPEIWSSFDFVLAETSSNVPGKWKVLDTVESYAGIGFSEGIPLASVLCAQIFPSGNSSQLCASVRELERALSQRIPGKRWPCIRMSPSINILKKV